MAKRKQAGRAQAGSGQGNRQTDALAGLGQKAPGSSLKDVLDPAMVERLKQVEKEIRAEEARRAQEEAERRRREAEERERNKSFAELLAEYESKGKGGKYG